MRKNGIALDDSVVKTIDAYMDGRKGKGVYKGRIGLEQECLYVLKNQMAQYIGFPKIAIKVKGHDVVEDTPKDRNYDLYFKGSSLFAYSWFSEQTIKHGKLLAQGRNYFKQNAQLLCDLFINERYGTIDNAFMAHVYFLELESSFLFWFDGKRERMKNKLTTQDRKNNLAKYKQKPYGAVANLLKTLTRTMELQGADIRSIAKMQYAVCAQANILLPDEFMNDVATALDVVGELDVVEDSSNGVA